MFCNIFELDLDTPGATARQLGYQAQVFVVVNDESYYYPNLLDGMIVNADASYGQDVVAYTGSSTLGISDVDGSICSQYSPLTWHVDRQCHLISASSMDQLCADMLAQPDEDLQFDVRPHTPRVLVSDNLAADFQDNVS